MKINHDTTQLASWRNKLRIFFSHKSVLGHIWNRFEWHWYPRLKVVRSYPIHIDIETSSKCQLKCPMCFRAHRLVENQGIMPPELYYPLIDEIAGKVYSIKFTGRGEPLLNKHMPEFLSYLKGKGFKEIAMITNGQLLREPVMKAMIEIGMDRVAFSIDGLKEEYERIRAPITYEEIQERVRSLWEMKQKMGSQKPLIRIQGVKTTIEQEIEFRRIWEQWADEILLLEYKDYSEESRIKEQDPSPCPFMWQRMMIHYNGTIPMCINDEYEETVMGKVGDKSLGKIWYNGKFKGARKVHSLLKRDEVYKNCKECALFRKGHGKK